MKMNFGVTCKWRTFLKHHEYLANDAKGQCFLWKQFQSPPEFELRTDGGAYTKEITGQI